MASVFTYEPDPPQVKSPWPAKSASTSSRTMVDGSAEMEDASNELETQVEFLSNFSSLSKLESEPQEGPVEYKLHLLLRSRRSATPSDTDMKPSSNPVSASRSCSLENAATAVPAGAGITTDSSMATSASSPMLSSHMSNLTISRQHRLEQLTTQLLWRLQQSTPYHSISGGNVVLPTLPAALPELRVPEVISKVMPGLEESKGALYEIGVADDGTLVGLTIEEMRESLTNLRAMAASLGCVVEVQRMVCVQPLSTTQDTSDDRLVSQLATAQSQPLAKLFVAEAVVKPRLRHGDGAHESTSSTVDGQPSNSILSDDRVVAVEQLRVSLTGATTSGKSSLLGTLSTSTLDNGRGKSRLSLLKHRHEIASGITSSVVQDLVGYQQPKGNNPGVRILNYADENINTWNDIHASMDVSRLALLSDSAGHPRFRRTTVRGLVGWAPHWTFLCIAANEDHSQILTVASDSTDNVAGDRKESQSLSSSSTFSHNGHVSMAHLNLCLKLRIPFVIVITKFDEATRTGLRLLLSTLLTNLKSAGRRPVVMSTNSSSNPKSSDMHYISDVDLAEVERDVHGLSQNPTATVLILLTSAVTGAGIGKLHALLARLPLLSIPEHSLRAADAERFNARIAYSEENPTPAPSENVFYIDDSFEMPAQRSVPTQIPLCSIVSGYVGYGSVSIGDELLLGPFTSNTPLLYANTSSTSGSGTPGLINSDNPSGMAEEITSSSFLTPRSFRNALAQTTSSPRLRPADPSHKDWRRVRVVSIRNLRLPVRTLLADQVGTIGIEPVVNNSQDVSALPLHLQGPETPTTNYTATLTLTLSPLPPIRRGMILSGTQQSASHTFTACFGVEEATSVIIGTVVVIYCATVRAGARVVAIALEDTDRAEDVASANRGDGRRASVDEGTGFRFDDDEEAETLSQDSGDDDASSGLTILVTFQFVASREWIRKGSKVLVMPGGGTAMASGVGGLEGFVGSVVETFI